MNVTSLAAPFFTFLLGSKYSFNTHYLLLSAD